MHTLDFEMSFTSDASISSKETVVFLPRSLYSQGQLDWTLSDGKIEYDEAVSVRGPLKDELNSDYSRSWPSIHTRTILSATCTLSH